MPPYKKHVFVCTTQRPPGHPRPSCGYDGAMDMHALLREMVEQAGRESEIAVSRAGCLGICDFGANMVIYPQGHWYQAKTLDHAREIATRALLADEVVEHLLIPDANTPELNQQRSAHGPVEGAKSAPDGPAGLGGLPGAGG